MNYQPPPTYADPIIVDDRTGQATFNPIWLQWFVWLAELLGTGGSSSVAYLADANSVLSNRSYGMPQLAAQADMGSSVLMGRTFAAKSAQPLPDVSNEVLLQRAFAMPQAALPAVANDSQSILATQIFGRS